MKRPLSTILSLILMTIAQQSYAAPKTPYIPPQLAPWVEWVREAHPTWDCAWSPIAPQCIWPSTIELELFPNRAIFSYRLRVDSLSQVPLPTAEASTPTNLVVRKGDESITPMIANAEAPQLELDAGDYTISGELPWKEQPPMILLPAAHALLSVKKNGVTVPTLDLRNNSELWLTPIDESEQVQDNLPASQTLTVFRRLNDSHPFEIETRIEITVSGAARELALGEVLPKDALPISTEGTLPLHYSPKSGLTVQLRPGSHYVSLLARLNHAPTELTPPANSHPDWPAFEYWSWQTNPLLRTALLEGGEAVDPVQVNLPPEWRNYPTYKISNSTLKINEVRRGEDAAPKNSLTQTRSIWLDQTGTGYTIKDSISGTMRSGWRLEMLKPYSLEFAQVAGESQPITQVKDSERGLEIRTVNPNLTTIARLEGSDRTLPASGWNQTIEQLSTNLHLPPGWSVFHISGTDTRGVNWVDTWNLLSLFISLLLSLAAYRLLGLKAGLLLALTLTLSHQRLGAPGFLWIHLIASFAVLKVNEFRLLTIPSKIYFAASALLIAAAGLQFSLYELAMGIFPHYKGELFENCFLLTNHFEIVLRIALILALVMSGLSLLTAIFTKRWRLFNYCLLTLCGLFVANLYNWSDSSYRYSNAPAPAMSARGMQMQYNDARLADGMEPQMLESGVAAYDMAAESFQGAEPEKRLRKSKNYLSSSTPAKPEPISPRDLPAGVLHTGPAEPSWSWTTIPLTWAGSVALGQTFSMVLFSPLHNFLLGLLRAILTVAICGYIIKCGLPYLKKQMADPQEPSSPENTQPMITATSLIASLTIILSAGLPTLNADDALPSPELLQQLESRLDARRCKTNCSTWGLATISISDDGTFSFSGIAHSDGAGSLALPELRNQFSNVEVTIDDAAAALGRNTEGNLIVRIPDGMHRVKLLAKVALGQPLTIPLANTLPYVEVNSASWAVDGVRDALGNESTKGKASSLLTFTPRQLQVIETEKADENSEALPPSDLSDWYEVRKSFNLGLEWKASTVVHRIGGDGEPTSLKLPLLPGESVTSGHSLKDGNVILDFPAGVTSVEWSSKLDPMDKITLSANKSSHMSETWELYCTTLFQCTAKGIPLTQSISGETHLMIWNPWKAEEVELTIASAPTVSGSTLTIDSVQHNASIGERVITETLQLKVRSTKGDSIAAELPIDAEVVTVTRNGSSVPIKKADRPMLLEVLPGDQEYSIEWRLPQTLGFKTKPSSFGLSTPLANVTQTLSLPIQRWHLWVSGPVWGPIFTFWLRVIFALATTLALSRYLPCGLKTHQWFLLGLGLTVLPFALMFIPPLWFLAIQKIPGSTLTTKRKLTVQICFVGLSLLSLAVFYMVIASGLVGAPPSNWVSAETLSGFSFYSANASELPKITLYSAPLWVWRALMFAWSGWAAMFLLDTLRRAWQTLRAI